MKAILFHNYGPPDVLICEEAEKPTPGDSEVLFKVRAASVNPLDWHGMRGKPYVMRLMGGLRKPKRPRLGVDVAGLVEATGKKAAQFKPGDEVFGGCLGLWAFAEFACAPASQLVAKPANLSSSKPHPCL
jgi:NADPH:quinone reductase-like Zn-dependent oxidoreductase